MQGQSCIEPCANRSASADGYMGGTLNVYAHSKCHLTQHGALFWAMQMKADPLCTWWLGKSHTLCLVTLFCTFGMTSIKLHSCSWHSKLPTSHWASLMPATDSSHVVNYWKVPGTYYPIYRSWARKDDTKFVSNGMEIFRFQQESLCKIAFFFV